MLILGNTKEQAEERATSLVKKLTELGITVNKAKSMKEATQQFTYVGHHFDLQKDIVSPTQEKQKITQQKCTHQIKGNNFQPRHLASLAVNLVDANKSNPRDSNLPMIGAPAVITNGGHAGHVEKLDILHENAPRRCQKRQWPVARSCGWMPNWVRTRHHRRVQGKG